jgi:hypothetical protein
MIASRTVAFAKRVGASFRFVERSDGRVSRLSIGASLRGGATER